jgi:uncharacterized protein YcgL (UPF0745 family)
MGIWSFLFPSDEDRLRRARALMADGRYEKARETLIHCGAPEAEALYDACSAAVDKAERGSVKKQLAAQGFHGWKVEVSLKSTVRKRELEALVTQELERAGMDLAMPQIDEDVFKAAVTRAQRRARGGGGGAMVKLVPIEGRAPR